MAQALLSSAWDAVQSAPLLSGCVAFQALRFLADDLYLGWRQRAAVQRATHCPRELQHSVSQDEFETSRAYALDASKLGMA